MLRYLDASFVIDATDPSAPRHGAAVAGLSEVAPLERCASDLVRLECLIAPLRPGDPLRVAEMEGFFAILNVFPISSEDCGLAARLRVAHGLKTPDALHLAIALNSGCGEFWTNDVKLAKKGVGIVFRTF